MRALLSEINAQSEEAARYARIRLFTFGLLPTCSAPTNNCTLGEKCMAIRPRFKPWIARNPSCRCAREPRSDDPTTTNAAGRPISSPRLTSRRERYWRSSTAGIARRSSASSCRRSTTRFPRISTFTSSSTMPPPTKPHSSATGSFDIPLSPAFHPNEFLLDQSRRALVQSPYRKAASTRSPSQHRSAGSSDPQLPHPLQSPTQAIPLAKDRRRDS